MEEPQGEEWSVVQPGEQSDIPTEEDGGEGSTGLSPSQHPWRGQDHPRRYKWQQQGPTLIQTLRQGPRKISHPEAQGDHDSQKQSPSLPTASRPCEFRGLLTQPWGWGRVALKHKPD